MSNIIFRMAAWTDAAGKYNPDAPLDGNEDNYYADDDLGDDTPSHIVTDEELPLSECGMIMSVSDGMGGMNAGEVASQIAHDTVAEYFAPGKITPQLAATHKSRSRYMEDIIREADRRIKAESRKNSEYEGMGATLIMAWLSCGELSITWIGDSRAYRFNPRTGIELLSKDHTYVQELVDKGFISYEQTFEHPQGNVVTRSLGDRSQKANPESRLFKIFDGDIILLCSDGLSGVLRDCKTYNENGVLYPGDNIEDIIREHTASLKECREALWSAAEKADWYDNVTAIICQIRSGAGEYVPVVAPPTHHIQETVNKPNKTFDGIVIKVSRKKVILSICIVVALIVAVGSFLWNNGSQTSTSLPRQIVFDSLMEKQEKNSGDTITQKRKDTLSHKTPEPSAIEIKQVSKVKKKVPLPAINAKPLKKPISIKKDSLNKIGEKGDVLTPVPVK